ncbi:unnamed protein product [Ectocarpus fasciculatus]
MTPPPTTAKRRREKKKRGTRINTSSAALVELHWHRTNYRIFSFKENSVELFGSQLLTVKLYITQRDDEQELKALKHVKEITITVDEDSGDSPVDERLYSKKRNDARTARWGQTRAGMPASVHPSLPPSPFSLTRSLTAAALALQALLLHQSKNVFDGHLTLDEARIN